MFQIMHHPYVDLKIACYENSRHRNIAIETFGNEYALIFFASDIHEDQIWGGWWAIQLALHRNLFFLFWQNLKWQKNICNYFAICWGNIFANFKILDKSSHSKRWWFCGIDAFFAITSFASIEKEASFLLCICYLHLGILLYSWCYINVAKIP